jgi:hypothetical protein
VSGVLTIATVELIRNLSSVVFVVENQKRNHPLGQDAELDNQGRVIVGVVTQHLYHSRGSAEQDLQRRPEQRES